MTEIAKKLEVSLAEKEEERSQLAEKLNSATFQQAENIKAVIEVNSFVKNIREFSLTDFYIEIENRVIYIGRKKSEFVADSTFLC